MHPTEKLEKVGLPRHVSDDGIRLVADSRADGAVVENCGILFSCLFDSAANAGVGSRRVGPARSCRKKQSVACSVTRCAESVSVYCELFLQQGGVAGSTLSPLR